MANYFKDLRSGAKNFYRQAKGNATLKGIDDHLDRVSAGGGKGVGDFLLDMSGIADMYQVGKQGAHIADDMYDGVDWADIDQGRKDALGRGALGTALTLAPVPGIKMARAGLRAGTGAAKRGAQNTFRTAFRDVGSRKLLPSPGTAPKGAKKMREALQKNLGKASATGRDRLTRSKAITDATDKEVRKAYNQLKGIKAPGLGSKYMANASDNIFGKPHGLLKTPLRVATGGGLTGPLYRAGKVGLKDLYRGTPEGYEDSEGLLSEIGHPGNPGAQGQAGPDGRGLTMEDYMEMGIDDPQLDAAISGGSAQAMAAAMELSKVKESKILTPENSPDIFHNGGRGPVEEGAPGGIRKVLSEIESAPGYAEKSKNASGQLNKTGGPIYDPRRGKYVRAESLTDEEQAAFAEVTAEKNGLRNQRLNTHDEKGRLLDNVDRFAIDRQNKARKSWDKIQDGYNRDDDMRGANYTGIYDSTTDEEANNRPKQLSDMDIHKLVSAHKVAMSNAERPPLTSEEMLNEEDNPFNFEKARAQEGRDFEELYESGAFEDDMSPEPEEDSFYDNWPTAPEDHDTTDYVDPSKGPGPRLSDIDTATTDYVDPNEPMPDPDAEAERWNRENPFAGADEPPALPPPSLDIDTSYNSPTEAPDLPDPFDFPPALTRPSTNGTSTTIRDLNNPAGGQEPSIEELIRELEALGFHR